LTRLRESILSEAVWKNQENLENLEKLEKLGCIPCS